MPSSPVHGAGVEPATHPVLSRVGLPVASSVRKSVRHWFPDGLTHLTGLLCQALTSSQVQVTLLVANSTVLQTATALYGLPWVGPQGRNRTCKTRFLRPVRIPSSVTCGCFAATQQSSTVCLYGTCGGSEAGILSVSGHVTLLWKPSTGLEGRIEDLDTQFQHP